MVTDAADPISGSRVADECAVVVCEDNACGINGVCLRDSGLTKALDGAYIEAAPCCFIGRSDLSAWVRGGCVCETEYQTVSSEYRVDVNAYRIDNGGCGDRSSERHVNPL